MASAHSPAAAASARAYSGPPREQLRADRAALLGPNCALNYSSHGGLLIVRGERQYLYDEAGNAYLDCVNNVAHVGHAHPHVVAAISSQLEALNTNSRFLHPSIVSYAARLTAKLPAPLSVVYYVNSGSEANDLALRLARAHTGRRGVVCVDGAYHGHTISIIDVSPYKYAREGGSEPRGSIRCVPQPDCFSGAFTGNVDDPADAARLAAAYAATVDEALASFAADEAAEASWKKLVAEKQAGGGGGGGDSAEAAGFAWAARNLGDDGLTGGCGAFIMESILSCGGQVLPPPGYLRSVYSSVRAAGGVCIADEVQVGFGRVGSHFWAFQLAGEDVIPDIVTLGKPIGNGFPVAAVITTPEIAASFTQMEYFNTFAGNPAAGAAANAVLDVIERDNLQAHAAAVGTVLLTGFKALRERFPSIIGSVRGTGLMVGLEILRPPPSDSTAPPTASPPRVPDGDMAAAVKYAMLSRKILISTDGMHDNVIKLKPPMTFTSENAERVCKELGEVFQELVQGAGLGGSNGK